MKDAPMLDAAPLAPEHDDQVVAAADPTPTETGAAGEAPAPKRRRGERREKLRKTALCKHFDRPGGCPFPNCRFAHGRDDVAADEGNLTLAAQRKFLREQVMTRTEERFQQQPGGGGEDDKVARRGTMIERYYTELFACDVMGKALEDQYVHMHSNRLCVVGVAPTHPVMREEIRAIVFTSHVLDSRVSGKKKRGGQFMLPQTILCHVHCSSGATYAIRSCIRGTLLEVNEELAQNPSLLQKKHESDGFLIIVQPKTTEVVEIQESMLTKSEYKQYREAAAASATATATATATDGLSTDKDDQTVTAAE